jgi:hypothetical protein
VQQRWPWRRYRVVMVLERNAAGERTSEVAGDTGRTFRTRRGADRECRAYNRANALDRLLPMHYEVRDV